MVSLWVSPPTPQSQTPAAPVLKGRPVSNEQEANAAMIDFDGSLFIFPSIQNGLCDGFYAQNTTMLQGMNGIQSQLCQGFNGVNNNIAESRFATKQCCCETNRNIDAVRYENARNTCDIVNAIKADGDATRALMTQNTI